MRNRLHEKAAWWGTALLLVTCQHVASAGTIRPISTTERTNGAASGGSYAPLFSQNGRFVVFVSCAPNLVTNDDLAPFLDVFARDLNSSSTTLISVNSSGVGGGNADANFPSISSNG